MNLWKTPFDTLKNILYNYTALQNLARNWETALLGHIIDVQNYFQESHSSPLI